MGLFNGIRRAVRGAVYTAGAIAAGTAALAFSRTEKAKELRRRAEEQIATGITSLRARLFGAAPVEAPADAREPSEQDPRVVHEHAREHGAEGRKWATTHASKPHLAATIGDGLRNAAARRHARHV
jgi:hypothetical protein